METLKNLHRNLADIITQLQDNAKLLGIPVSI